ncbi:dTDP-4-dehydrorhamnose reductase [Proteiniclasticum ruminis]|uniref:dTDP-4-dehydrorhamnose reductase n=2 Tax=Proteiniclasticum ruminis TaxID=398199 RepID=A0A1I5A5S1_9CLOT|nr:dTDP-4-dehydrorhamnose reductase [Proteiniclasticum ruminis]SFN57813.1 dTDP-4-dehydrorhamnose reductase [Proteiniclasticum ruminis]
MRILVTGARGQLGHDVMKELLSKKLIPIGVDREEMDITNKEDVHKYMDPLEVDAVIHCAAYTAVDQAEEEIELCRKINVEGTRYIAEVCKSKDIPMMYISTDYVFDGKGSEPFLPDSPRNPVNFYGQAKYEGELVVEELLSKYFIVRISWVFGENGKNFVRTMLDLGKKLGKLTVVNDQFGSPTYTSDLSKLLVEMIQSKEYGTYHATNEGICSWFEFATEIFKQAGLPVDVQPVDSSAFKTKAVRPLNSRMSKEKLVEKEFEKLPDWKDALSRYLKVIDY